MKKTMISLAGAALAILALVATTVAAGPGTGPGPGPAADGNHDTIAAVLGLTHDEIAALRHEGLSLAQIAERQEVDPQRLVDALVARWTERIEARVDQGALTPEKAATLKVQVETQAKHMVYRTTMGGMQGGAVGAGPMHGDGRMGPGNGRGQMHGNGQMGQMHGNGRMGPGNGRGQMHGSGQMGQMHGSGQMGQMHGNGQMGQMHGNGPGAGNGTCDGSGMMGNAGS
jgi:hypothetical protein